MLEADANYLRTQALLGANLGNLRTQLTWSHRHGFDVTPTVANNQQTKADSFDVLDLFFKYDLSRRGGLFDDLTVSLAVNNVLDADAPLYRGTSQTTQGHGYINGFHVGRLFQIGVNKKL
jgi:iron complex outermembrane recepter protein